MRWRPITRLAFVGALGMALVLAAGCGTDPARTLPDPTQTPATAAPTPVPSPGATVPTTPTPDASPAQPASRSVTVVMNGDLLWHNTLWYGAAEDARRQGRRGHDFAPALAGLKPVVSRADLAICHQEVPLAPAGGPFRNYPLFAAPPSVVDAIRATGYDLCTTASNHSLDQGFRGIVRTIDAFDRAKIRHVGSARSAREAERPVIVTVRGGVRVAVVAATFGLNGLDRPAGREWAVNLIDADAMISQAKRARAAGADIVLAAVHAGTEYATRENAQQVALARRLTVSPAVDLVYMHHAHVVQPWTRMHGKWVVYGLGNTIAQHRTPGDRSYEGVTARFTFTADGKGPFRVTRAEYIPTLITKYRPGAPARVLQVSAALPQARGALRERLELAQRRCTAVVTSKQVRGLHRG